MKIIIEGHSYTPEAVQNYLWEGAFQDIKGYVCINYVGYYYNPRIEDCVFILPKVLLDTNEKTFGQYTPEEILSIDKDSPLQDQERKFIYEFSVWTHRAIVVFAQHNKDNGIVLSNKQVSEMGHSKRRLSNTFLDILLALIEFQRENNNFILFTLRLQHSGYNKINWTRTIAHEQAFLQNKTPLYLRMQNKKRVVNFDEELLVIYYSILHYINEQYGFPINIPVGFELITGKRFEQYLKGYGTRRLRQIKYKYFSDTTKYLWDLCNAFFEQSSQVYIQNRNEEYLLVSSFEIVFETMIDQLIGDPRNELPDGLKDQADGKRVDHLYKDKGLTNDELIYYIGDSKYYKRSTQLSKESVYKQYTYARNVIQWNLDLFLDGKLEDQKGHTCLRDDVTEGYNITPNFFISAEIDKDYSYEERLDYVGDDKQQTYNSRQFNNRLFDRDTLLLAHYNVNFLYVVALYARDSRQQQAQWKEKVRSEFRTKIREMLEQQYDFYAMTAHEGVDGEQFLRNNFQSLLGKVFSPYGNTQGQQYYSVALDNNDKYKDENENVVALLETKFYIEPCQLGESPIDKLPKVVQYTTVPNINDNLLTIHYIQRYLSQENNFLVGCYKDKRHLNWILRGNDKQTLIYNVRIKRRGDNIQRNGTLPQSALSKVQFVLLYNLENPTTYRVFHVHHTAVMDKERMLKSGYHEPKSSYFCFVFDEEVNLMPQIDLNRLIGHHHLDTQKQYKQGEPILCTSEQLLNFQKQ